MIKTAVQMLLAGLLVISVSCNKDNGPSGPGSQGTDVILPLKVGNQWILQLTYSDTTPPGLDTMRVTRDTLIQNERWYSIQDPFLGTSQSLVTNRGDGLWVRNDQSLWLRFKYPSFAGDAYSYLADTMRVVSVATEILVPGGKFSCYRYKDFGGDWYLSPNVGYVKFPEFAVTSDSGPTVLRTVRLELLKAILK